MTRKQKIVRMLRTLGDSVTYDQIIDNLIVMRNAEIGLEQAARGEVIDHDEVFDRLLAKYEKVPHRLVSAGKRAAGEHRAAHRMVGAGKRRVALGEAP